MKRRTIKDYHELDASITVQATRNKPMTDEEKRNYDHALSLLLGSDFEISLRSTWGNILASFGIKNGIVDVLMADEISEEF